jgi:DNA-binding transcriptional LysR family regulator
LLSADKVVGMKRRSGLMAARSDLAIQATEKVIDSRRLLYFYHVAKAGRFTAAEAILDVAQSAMSRQIQQLERDLGVQLLDRTGHGVKLTGHGEILYRRAESILSSMSMTVDELQNANHQPLETISIAAPPSFMASYMADVINGFTKARPSVRICAVEASTGGVYNYLASGQVDVAIVLQTANTARLSLRELTREQLYLVAASGHPIEAQRVVARHQLRELDLVLPASLYGSRAILSDYFAAEDIPLRSQIEADSLPLMRELLRTRRQCAILPKISCEAELASGQFFARPLKPALSRTLYIAQLRDTLQSETMTVLVDQVVRAVKRRQPRT